MEEYRNADVVRIENANYSSGGYGLRWKVTALCNYHCDFCVQGTREEHLRAAREESPTKRAEILRGIVRLLEGELADRRLVDLVLIGGEVTILPDFPDILRTLVECSFEGHLAIHVITNLSMPAEQLLEMCRLFGGKRWPSRSFSLFASYYPAYTTEEEFFGKMRELAIGCRQVLLPGRIGRVITRFRHSRYGGLLGGARVTLGVGYPMMDDSCYEDLLRVRQKYGRYLSQIKPIIIRGYPTSLSDKTRSELAAPRGGRTYVTFADGTTKAFSSIRQLGLELSDVERFNPTGMACDAGWTGITVDTDGTIMRCPTLGAPASFCLGSVMDEGIRLPDGPLPCTADHCSCDYYHIMRREHLLGE